MATTTINNTDLKTGMKIVIPAGNTLSINGEVYRSNISPGFIVAETAEMGPLYLDGSGATKVLTSEGASDGASNSAAGNTGVAL